MTKIGNAPARWLGSPRTPAVSEAPSERISPPSAQLAARQGSAATNALFMLAGTATCGRSEARQAPSGTTVSGIRSTATSATAKAPIRIQNTNRVGSGP